MVYSEFDRGKNLELLKKEWESINQEAGAYYMVDFKLGMVNYYLKDYKASLKYYQQHITNVKADGVKLDGKLLGSIAFVNLKAGNKQNADKYIIEFKTFIEKNPLSYERHKWLAEYNTYKGNFDEAIRYYKKTIGIDPGNVEAHIKLGSAYYRKEMFDEAVTEFRQAVALDPDNEDARISLRHAYSKKNKT